MGNSSLIAIQKCNYDDILSLFLLQNTRMSRNYILLNTLPVSEQQCLILHTVSASDEEEIMNTVLKENKNIPIFIYGKNTNDESIVQKYLQLKSIGFQYVYVYLGGIFEWLLLQDIYGKDAFPTTTTENDLLKYKPISQRI